ncbi:hypothetical protein ACFVJK_28270 [Streptomyces sp. NPDC127172]|uniref:hypothetical protein n=1 Tax=Streptomyces sp. NPDC127172 TaxID=3345382 RepID=UPI0036399A15
MRMVPRNSAAPFLARVRVQDFRSIESCDVSQGALTVLVEANASGKSIFLDATRFVRDMMVGSPPQLDERGGLERVLRNGASGDRLRTIRRASSPAFDIDQARANSPSFDKFCRDAQNLITAKRGH